MLKTTRSKATQPKAKASRPKAAQSKATQRKTAPTDAEEQSATPVKADGSTPMAAGPASAAAASAAKTADKPVATPTNDDDKTSILRESRHPEPYTTDDLAPVSPVPAPDRPAWRPMEVRAAGPGVTVFGTRLTYRQAAIGAGILVLVLVLVITLVAQAVSDETDPAGTPPNAAPTTAASGAGTPSAAPSSAAPSSPAASSPGPFTLPAGWQMVKVPAGNGLPAFTVPVPNGAERSGDPANLRFKWNNRLLLVGRTTSPAPDAYQDWVQQEPGRRGEYRAYQKIRIDRVKSWRGFPSVADWEYFYTTDGGNRQHVIRRNFVVNDKAAYSLSWYASPDDWAASQSDLNAIFQGFQPN